MLQLYDLNKVKIKGLRLYKDMNIESVLSSGDKTLSFLYPSRLSKDIKEECYIRTKKDEFVVKEISTNGEWNSIKATLNVENLEGQAWEHFDTTEKTISECLTLAVAGTGWTVQVNGVTKRRTIRKTNCSTWDIIQQAKKTYLVEIEFDTINKIVKVAEKLGSDKGVYFMDSLNLRKLDVQSNSYDFYTRLVAIGKDDLKVTVENYQYSSKKKTFIWKDERYTDINSLTEDATKKLDEISKPYKAYGADIIDLANTSNKYSILSYGLGDTIALISKDKGIKEKQRIVKITEYPEEPHRNSCEIANSILSFADVQKEYNDTMDTVSNITEDNGTVSEGAIRTAVEHLTVNKLDVGSLNAVEIRVGNLEATSATITQLKAVNASIVNLQANKANITDLTASVGRIEILESSVGDIQTLVNGNLTSNNIQSLILSSDKVTVVNGFIKNAMIENLDVSKINAGDISVNKFRIKSDSGNLLIFDNTIQIKDSTRVRVQIGKDASSDYNMYVWDSSGKLMFDATGLKADGIKNKIIRDDMVSDNANISGDKLNISSVVTSINNGATTINSSKVLLDGTAQTLNVAFNTLTTKVDSAPPSITTESSITKLDDAIDGMLKINSIKGNTLQNVLPKVEFLDIVKTYSTTSIDNVALVYNPISVYTIKPSTEYTLIFKVNYTNCTLSYFYLAMNYYNTSNVSRGVYYHSLSTNSSGELFKIKITTPSDIRNLSSVFLGGKEGSVDIKTGGYYMVLEGDWTNKEVTYFEGIRSVSENGETSEVISKGENLLDINKIKDSGKTTSDVVGDTVTVSSFEAYAWLRSSVECKVKPNTDYYCDFEISDTTNGFVNINTPLGFLKDLGIKGGTFNSGNNSKIIIGLYATTTTAKINNVTYSNLRLTEGNTSKPYEPYKEHRQLITLTNPLRGLPNGVRDTIDFERGMVVRNVGKVVFDGSESWSIATSDPNNHIYTKVLKCKAGHNQYLICDKCSNSRVSWPLAPPNTVCTSSSSDGQIGFNFLIGTYTIATWKAELQANPVTVYFPLAIPIEEPINVEQYMKQFKDGHFLTEGSLINPTIELEYSTSLASALSTMKEVTESNTTALNIQQGQISTLISNTTIVKDGQTIQLKDAYNSTVATVNSINSVISEHTSTINNLTGQVTGVETKTNEVRRDLDGTIEIVSKTKVTAESALFTATEAKQTADGFTQRVSNIEQTALTIDGKVTSLSTRMNTAEQQITDTAIVSTVRSSTYYKNDLGAKVSTNAIISSINQTAESIKISASKINLTGYVTMTNLSTAGQTTIDGGNIKTSTISLERLKSATNNPIIKMFGECSIDATANNELGVGTAIRLKWNENTYIRIAADVTDIYQNGVARFRFYPNYLDCKPPSIYFADQCKIDASAGTFRFYISKSVDTGIRISPDGTISFMIAGTPRHVFNTNGTKAGGTIVVDGTTLGMSPIDSPKVLLEDVLFDIDIQEEGTTVSLDSTFLKTISTYSVFCSNPSVNIVSKDKTSFTVRGYTGKVDFRVIGYRIGYEEQYYQVVG